MSSVAGKRSSSGGFGRAVDGGALSPNQSGHFDEATLEHIERELIPQLSASGETEKLKLAEQALAKYGRAVPNHASGLWEPLEFPRSELQLREMYAHRMSEFGYQLVCSHEQFPDWLLVDSEGRFVYAEVEHRSSGFRDHGHNSQYCDLIVCWEHDWSECPLPVLELFGQQVFEPSEPDYGRANRRGLAVNFAGRLSRYTPSETKHSYQQRREYAVSRYDALVNEGFSQNQAMRQLGKELNVGRESARRLLNLEGKKLHNSWGNGARQVERVRELKLAGATNVEAIHQTAQEFGVKENSLRGTLNRYKYRLTSH